MAGRVGRVGVGALVLVLGLLARLLRLSSLSIGRSALLRRGWVTDLVALAVAAAAVVELVAQRGRASSDSGQDYLLLLGVGLCSSVRCC